LVAVSALVLSLTSAAGCGSSNNDNSSSTTTTSTTPAATTTTPSGGGAASNLKIEADPSGALKFTKSTLNAKAGKVTIKMDNPSPIPHAIGIKGNGVTVDGSTVNKGGVSTVTGDLKAGKYEFYCPVDGHEQAGMKGTLTIK
jgi:uncharacterized cupredoxin-like copper-binding protein